MRTTSGSCCTAVMAELSVSLALVGGDPRLARAVAAAVEGAGSHTLLPPSAADRAAVLLVADDVSGAGLDRLRAEVLRRPERPTLLVAGESGVDAQAAMAAGARGVLEQPVTASDLREALARAAAFIRPDGGAAHDGPVVVLLGAAGGVGTTTCAVALAAGLPGAVLLDLDLAAGDAAAVAGALVAEPDALLTLATAPAGAAGGIATRLASGGCCPVLPAPRAARAGRPPGRGGHRPRARRHGRGGSDHRRGRRAADRCRDRARARARRRRAHRGGAGRSGRGRRRPPGGAPLPAWPVLARRRGPLPCRARADVRFSALRGRPRAAAGGRRP